MLKTCRKKLKPKKRKFSCEQKKFEGADARHPPKKKKGFKLLLNSHIWAKAARSKANFLFF
jgi:hypothetical protein